MGRQPSVEARILRDRTFFGGLIALSLLAVLPLLLILGFVVARGASAVNWAFLSALPAPVGETGGGILNSIVGSVILLLTASVIAIPLGVFTGIFLAESGGRGLLGGLGTIARLSIETLMGIPSIVIGIVAYVWVVKPMGRFSALSGGIALAMIMLPVIALSTEETLRMIPVSLREASLALGVSYPRTVLKVILPAGMSGVVTGSLLAAARGLGETAPLLFTAFGNPFLSADALKPIASLPLTIFNYATSPYPEWHSLAWGASFVLLIFVLTLNLVTKTVTARWKTRF